MRFDSWSKTKKQELNLTYQNLFGGQVRFIKRLYKNKKDPILLDELLTNVSINVFQTLELNQIEQAEALIERMFLSTLEYDVLIVKDDVFNEYNAYLYFFNDYHTIEYNEIRIKDPQSTKLFLEMILYIGLTYDQLIKFDTEAEQNLSDYELLEGFDAGVIEYTQEQLEDKRFIS